MGSSSGFGDKEKDQNLLLNEGRLEEYEEDEDGLICARFSHLDFCACSK